MLEKPELFENTKEYENLRNFIEKFKYRNLNNQLAEQQTGMAGVGMGNYVVDQQPVKEKVQNKKVKSKKAVEQMLPKKAFVGSNKNKLGTAGQLRNQKRGAKAGDLVGSSESIEETKQRLDAKCWKGYKKSGTKMKSGKRVNNCVPIGESWEQKISTLVEQLSKK